MENQTTYNKPVTLGNILNHLWKHGAVPGGCGALYLVSESLSSLYDSDSADEQFHPLYDRLRKSDPVPDLFRVRRCVEHRT